MKSQITSTQWENDSWIFYDNQKPQTKYTLQNIERSFNLQDSELKVWSLYLYYYS